MIATNFADLAMREGAAQKRNELAAFIDWLAGRDPLRTVVEIGTLRGGTLAAWCALAADGAHIVSIDLPGGKWGGGYAETDEPRLRGYAQPGQTLTLIRGDSHDLSTRDALVRAIPSREVDLLFIDGDHSYEGALQDFADYGETVRTGGVVAFHDILPHPNVPGCDVDRVWRDIADGYEHAEFTDPGETHPEWGQWGGIGALIV